MTYLFLALGMESDRDRMQAWAEATIELSVAQLDLGCRKLAREWKRGTPRPADLIASVRERRPDDPLPDRFDAPVGPFVRLDDMASAMGLKCLSELASADMTDEEREIACERYETALRRGEVKVYAELPKVGGPRA